MASTVRAQQGVALLDAETGESPEQELAGDVAPKAVVIVDNVLACDLR